MSFIDFCYGIVILSSVGFLIGLFIWALELLAHTGDDERKARPYDWAEEEL